MPNIQTSIYTSRPKMSCNTFNPLSMLVSSFCVADENTDRALRNIGLDLIRFLTLQLDRE